MKVRILVAAISLAALHLFLHQGRGGGAEDPEKSGTATARRLEAPPSN